MHFLKKGQKFRAWEAPPPSPLIRAMPERKRFFLLMSSLSSETDLISPSAFWKEEGIQSFLIQIQMTTTTWRQRAALVQEQVRKARLLLKLNLLIQRALSYCVHVDIYERNTSRRKAHTFLNKNFAIDLRKC